VTHPASSQKSSQATTAAPGNKNPYLTLRHPVSHPTLVQPNIT